MLRRAAALSLRHRGAARPAGGLQGRGCGRRGAGPGACLSSVGLQAVHAVTSGVIGRFPRWIVSVFVGKWFKRFPLRCPSFFIIIIILFLNLYRSVHSLALCAKYNSQALQQQPAEPGPAYQMQEGRVSPPSHMELCYC